MRIVVNDIAASTGGALTVLKSFYDYVLNYGKEHEWIFLLCDHFIQERENIKIITFPNVKKNHFLKILFDCFKGKKTIGKLNPDIVISLQNIITFGVKVPQIVYVHQSIPFQNIKKFSFFKRNEYKFAIIQYIIGFFIHQSIKKADYIVVQTEWMKNAVIKQDHIDSNKISVIVPEITSHPFLDNIPEFSSKKFFYPTSNALYKNNQIIVKACDILYSQGITDFHVYMTLPPDTIKHKSIDCIGYIECKELYKYYLSTTLLFPSYIETVGLPLLEAKSVGGNIIASDCPHCHDALKEYKYVKYFYPFNVNDLVNLMKEEIKNNLQISHRYNKYSRHKNSWYLLENIFRNYKF